MSLYNEVRPTFLGEIKGQEPLVAQIRSILESGNIPNVSLFIGPRGTGKTTMARIFAKSMNCESPSEDGFCGKCASCKTMAIGQSDINELDAASHNKVEDVHKIIEGAAYKPVAGFYKVYIIDEVHMLSAAAFNALLKLLEEPPSHTKFILCTTEEHKVPVTIKSRCRSFYFQRIPLSAIAEKMENICKDKRVPFEYEALLMIAKASDGCMRDAESLLEIFIDAGTVDKEQVSSVLGSTEEDSLFSILNGLFSGDSIMVCDTLREVFRKGKSLSLLSRALIETMTDMVLYLQSTKIDNIAGTERYKVLLQNVAERTSVTRLFRIIDGLGKILPELSNTSEGSFLLETTLLGFFYEESKLIELETKVEKLLSGKLAAQSTSPEKDNELFTRFRALEKKCEALEEALFGEKSISSKETNFFEKNLPAEETPGLPLAGANEEEFFALPDVSGELPGDISLPEGTKVMGTISLFGNASSKIGDVVQDDFKNVNTETIPFEEKEADVHFKEELPDKEESSAEDSSGIFSAFQGLWGIPVINELAKKL